MEQRLDLKSASKQNSSYSMIFAAFIGLSLLAVLYFLVPVEKRALFTNEGGPIEIFSAAGYLIVSCGLLLKFSKSEIREKWYMIVIPIAMSFREMDFHSRFTTMNLTKTKFYIASEVSLYEKAFGVLIIGLLGWSVYRLISGHGKQFIHALRKLEGWAIALLIAFLCVLVSNSLDGFESNVRFLGYNINTSQISVLFEEILELGIPIFMAISVYSYFYLNNILYQKDRSSF